GTRPLRAGQGQHQIPCNDTNANHDTAAERSSGRIWIMGKSSGNTRKGSIDPHFVLGGPRRSHASRSCPKHSLYPLQSSTSKSRQPYSWLQISRAMFTPLALNSLYSASAFSTQTYASQASPCGSIA